MDEKILRIRSLFQDVVPSFGITHAKVYSALMSGEVKTAKQLSGETSISHNKIYSLLKDLIREKIVHHTNTNPINYHTRDPAKTYERIVNRRIALLEKLPEEFDKIVSSNPTENDEKEYLIKFCGKQTRLFDNKNKAMVQETNEARQIVKQLNIYIEELKPKKEYNFVAYR